MNTYRDRRSASLQRLLWQRCLIPPTPTARQIFYLADLAARKKMSADDLDRLIRRLAPEGLTAVTISGILTALDPSRISPVGYASTRRTI